MNKTKRLQAVLELKIKTSQISANREVASKRHELAEAEFEALLQDQTTAQDIIEAQRARVVSLYEQYIDGCLSLRTLDIETDRLIKQLTENPNE